LAATRAGRGQAVAERLVWRRDGHHQCQPDAQLRSSIRPQACPMSRRPRPPTAIWADRWCGSQHRHAA
jgi:hypothetical protein